MAEAERHGLGGRLTIEVRDATGALVEQRAVRNLITTAGRMLLAEVLTGRSQIQPSDIWIGIGSAADPPTPADIALGEPVDASTATISGLTTEPGDGGPAVVAKVEATFPSAPGSSLQPIREAGILIGKPGAAVLYNHVVFAEINRSGTTGLTLGWEVLF